MSAERDLDIVVYGATGFVGRLLAEYLAEHAPDDARIALAGRSHERLAGIQSTLEEPGENWELIVADSDDADALARMARRARVVATTVGPYRKYGMKLVEACAAAGTHYADLTGEVLFMRDTIDRFHDAAAASGARIVHSCGFDSIPSDLGVLLLHEAAKADGGSGELEATQMVVSAMRGGMSGGTIASLKGQVDEMRQDSRLARIAMDPYALSPDRSREPQLGDEGDLRGVERDDVLGVWVAPFVMAAINTRNVRRSNALLDYAYGRRFKYREVMSTGGGPLGPVKSAAVAGGVGALVAGLSFGPTRTVLDRVLPDPGDGPSEESRRKGYFRIDLHASGADGRRYRARVAAKGDPGYAATAVMLGESALCLARDEDRLPDRAGVLTPAVAMGHVLIERLRAAGQTLEGSAA
ncbi:MAG TPA: saccharopine dehydrogenase NADP-binding domain-containing protein [Solirubrobacteraceae bacterium]|jgi:short subunit dehydrogenase-like uncharacterized protein